ncbi:ABC transporter substrate-binding protein [Streptomyces sp. NPDC093085]|uniref:ABC transporter substrate-binding protein n=1 Tax=Streptomyces sp. NPDC093085 TaxID=3155068 RepID=UPI0034125741
MSESRSDRGGPPRRRTVLATAAAGLTTALTGTLTGCSGTTAGGGASSRGIRLTFSWWGNDDRAERTVKAVRLFEQEHPGVTVATTTTGFAPYIQKLATQAAGGGIPDVAQLDYRQISQYARGGALIPLGDSIEGGAIRTDEMDQDFLRTGMSDGKQYALPMGSGITGYAYDSALYRKAGISTPRPSWTWREWADANREIAALRLRGPNGRLVTGAGDGGGNEDVFETWLRSRGGRLYSEEGAIAFSEDDLTEFWTFCDQLRRDGAISAAKDTVQSNSTENSPLGRGISGADFNWNATYPAFRTLLGDAIRFAPVPTTDGHPGTYFKPSMLLGIGAHTAHPEEAAALIDFLLNDERAGDALGFTRSTPPNHAIAGRLAKDLEGPELETYQYAQVMERYGLDAPPTAPPRGDVAVQTAFSRTYQRVMYELTGPRQAARELIAAANRELRS